MEWLNYHHLQYFWEVARTGSLVAASESLRLAPQTLSGQIRHFEHVLGQTLFDRRAGRLVLNDVGRMVFSYADELFSIGRELQDSLKGRPSGRPIRLVVGVADVVPQLVAQRILDPALHLAAPVHLVCRKDTPDRMLAELAIHALDLVLSDAPIGPSVKVRAYNHPLGDCGVSFFAAPRLAAALKGRFPRCLDGAPVLLPTDQAVLRRSLDQWFHDEGLGPRVVAEFDDSTLLKSFGRAGVGVFAAPTIIEAEVRRQYGVRVIGRPEGVLETYYAMSVERRLTHPAVTAICTRARDEIFEPPGSVTGRGRKTARLRAAS